ncbi:hypothetical protein Q0590_14160 [Rhodocytophaga aerolata]|uniref:Uncharacterized protein n=1 Tax=Rhodocytophaga aerolata TaxID=455078 RepID=A0ABT8R5P0_9BACT|nr:hypothetical protein [Rhodocytophaga aerolata]MDO1447408.1 hypothetical protein [Rhodocytophaga aerolata]
MEPKEPSEPPIAEIAVGPASLDPAGPAREPGTGGSAGGGGAAAGHSVSGRGSRGGQANVNVSVGGTNMSVSSTVVNCVQDILQSYTGKGFFGGIFSPSNIPGTAMQQAVEKQLREAQRDFSKSPGAGQFIEGVIKEVKEGTIPTFDASNTLKIVDGYKMEYMRFVTTRTVADTTPALNAYPPLIIHNVRVPSSRGEVEGMIIQVPGYIQNLQGKKCFTNVRFYTADGKHPIYGHHKDRAYIGEEQRVLGTTGYWWVPSQFYHTMAHTFYIPYYALNLTFSNRQTTHTFMVVSEVAVFMKGDRMMNRIRAVPLIFTFNY